MENYSCITVLFTLALLQQAPADINEYLLCAVRICPGEKSICFCLDETQRKRDLKPHNYRITEPNLASFYLRSQQEQGRKKEEPISN